MGTKSDIRWFQNFLQIDSDIEVLELSDIYPNKGTDRYYRSYEKVERKYNKYRKLRKASKIIFVLAYLGIGATAIFNYSLSLILSTYL